MPLPLNHQFGKRVHAARLASGTPHEAFADRFYLSRTFMFWIEAGGATPSPVLIKILVDAFDIELSGRCKRLLGGSQDMGTP